MSYIFEIKQTLLELKNGSSDKFGYNWNIVGIYSWFCGICRRNGEVFECFCKIQTPHKNSQTVQLFIVYDMVDRDFLSAHYPTIFILEFIFSHSNVFIHKSLSAFNLYIQGFHRQSDFAVWQVNGNRIGILPNIKKFSRFPNFTEKLQIVIFKVFLVINCKQNALKKSYKL